MPRNVKHTLTKPFGDALIIFKMKKHLVFLLFDYESLFTNDYEKIKIGNKQFKISLSTVNRH